MKPKILQVRGIAYEKSYKLINDELRNDFGRNLKIIDELNFVEAYKTNKRGCHFDIYLGETGTIIFRPFHYIDGLDDWCYFGIERFSKENRHAIEFYQWSSKRHSKMELWLNNDHLITASQKKSIRAKGNKTLIKNNDVYESTNFYIKKIVGLNIEELTDEHKIYRCEVLKKKSSYQQW